MKMQASALSPWPGPYLSFQSHSDLVPYTKTLLLSSSTDSSTVEPLYSVSITAREGSDILEDVPTVRN